MPKTLTKFNTSWLSRIDADDNPVKVRLKRGTTPTSFKCSLCQTSDLDCGNQGWRAIDQHMKVQKHKQVMNEWKQNRKFTVLTPTPFNPTDSSKSTTNSIPVLEKNYHNNKPLAFDEEVTKAEILWTMNVAKKGYAYKSCDELNELFKSMFPDSAIATRFHIQSNNMSYVMSNGLGSYFKKQLVNDVKKADRFVLIFDEQTNNQNKKQLDMLLRYWCNHKQRVVTRFYKSVILGHA
ncbi:unnamed protein product [Rotaria magnacalcarata]|uniref:Uncharacterized protein n=1 Tax=Rotaria magnacalcarata TaxID=392030 RepID=A0A820LME8_9BILA|nr:unnamed protein product [Rotaria magnacalcarata]CAF2082520.1 unnamed protein product [Rotaria magnacalcarata]CAF4359158.1 unnamed protein product [Rotaria magnacalcarata]CAF4451085.1 unnamed protein product [Rotaria magnacalcarata]